MKKKLTQLRWLVTMILFVTAMAMPKMAWAEITPTQPSIGDGTSANPYQIGTPEELYWFAALVNGTLTDGTAQNLSANAVLTADITVNTGVLNADGTLASNTSSFRVWTPIGTSSNLYKGTFDGQGHEVIGLYFNDTSAENVGMFGCSDGTVKNVGVVDSYFSGNMRVGGVCGYNYNGISNCYNRSTVNGVSNVGGIVGVNWGSECTIRNCYNTGSISASNYGAGGIAGYNYYGTITDCYSSAAISAPKTIGGICGATDGKSTIKNCYHNSRYYTGNAIGTTSSSGTEENVSAKTEAQFASGEVCYLLNGSTSDGAWGQTIGTDKYPVLGGDKVYYGYADCDESKDKTYSNTELADTRPAHNFNEHGFCTVCGAYQPATDSDSDGVYEIGNAGQLYWFAALVNGTDSLLTQNKGANAVLTADITVNTGVLNADGTLASDVSSFRVWTIIGNSSNKYTGTFDGQNYTISGLYFNNTSIDYVGLFGFVGGGGEISNVGVVDSYFKGNNYTGGVCGKTYSTITNCYNTGAVSGSDKVGGVCGESFCGEITNCYNTGAVSGSNQIGGVCGFGNGSTITNCYNTGEVTATGDAAYVGGVCGESGGKIINCYNTGKVDGSFVVGGVCGRNGGKITNCYFDSNKYSGNAVGKNSGTVSENVIGKTTTQFASGEVAYLLSLGCTVGDGESEVTYDGSVWGQTIGTDKYPVLGGDKVYYGYADCDESKDKTYSNTKLADTRPGHNFNEHGFCTVCGAYQPATDSDSDGVYEIGNAGQLYWFAALVNGDKRVIKEAGENASKNAVLTKDITVNSGVLKEDGSLSDNSSSFTSWTPIGYFNSYEDKCPYTGTFDGQNHKISGLYFNSSKNSVGLFGYVENGTVKNVGVEDSYFNVVSSNGEVYVGGVCGYNISGTITNCYNTGKVSVSSTSAIYAGGVCGWNGGAITNCYNTGKVTSTSDAYAGGVCGVNGGEIKSCYNTGEVTDTATSYAHAGGVCGCNVGEITNCYNEGLVNASGNTVYAGGVCGDNDIQSGSGTPTIANCYSTGSVTANVTDTTGTSNSGTAYAGGVCGSNGDEATITNCYFDSNKYSGNAVGKNSGTVSENVIGKTTTQFASGEVAYLLSLGCTVGDGESEVTYDGSVWGQTIGTDKYPVLGGLPVYYRDEVYTNTYGILTEGTQTITASNEPLVWYEFTPTETGSYKFSSTQLTAGNLYVNTTKTESDYTDIATSPTYDLEAATTYYVAVNYAPGSYDLTITRINNTPTAIETVTAPQIYAVDGRIVCEGEFRIYDLLGRDVTHLNGSLCGVYVVKTADAAQKVVVK